MHRSGTSSLAGCLQQMGLYLGKVFEENPFNLRGNRENERIMRLNDALLHHNGGSWSTPRPVMKWNEEHCEERDAIIREFEEAPVPMWGFKDPRMLFTFPFWEIALPNARLAGTFRHPANVARSLTHRNNMHIDDGINLWGLYNGRLIDILRNRVCPIVSFDVPADQYLMAVDLIAEHIGLRLSADHDPAASFFDKTLRQDKPEITVDLPAHIQNTYRELNAAYERLGRPS